MNLSEKRNNFILYTDANGNVMVEVFLQDETLCGRRKKALAKLFDVGAPAIT